MCIDKQTGECHNNGPLHNHTWKWTRFTGPKLSMQGIWAAQYIGQRDDDQFFEQNSRGFTEAEVLADELRMKTALDCELKCCTCNGRTGHE